MKHQTAQDLHVKRPHPDRSPGSLTNDGKSLDQDVIRFGAALQLISEMRGLRPELFIRHRAHRRLQPVDLMENQGKALHFPVVFASKHLFQNQAKHKIPQKKTGAMTGGCIPERAEILFPSSGN